jgi:predicted RNA-binding protein YlxR (DUF448 family)
MLEAADSERPEPVLSERAAPVRTCVGCQQSEERVELIRLAFVDGHEPPLVPDLAGKLGGRGVWLHARSACVHSAVKRGGFARSLKRPMKVDEASLPSLIVAQVERRLDGLIGSAIGRRAAALGTDSVRAALTTGAAKLLVVAKDAAGRRNELTDVARERGCAAVELADKATLGRLARRGTLGIFAILDAGIAEEVGKSARQLAGLSEDE